MSNYKLCGVLFGRGGSKGLPGKNLMPILSRPVLEYPLMAMKYSKYIASIYCSSDSEKIFTIADNYGAIRIKRPDELSNDTALLQDAISHSAKTIIKMDPKVTHLAITMCNCPNILAETIDTAFEKLIQNSDLDSVITVGRYDMFSPERARKLNTDDNNLVPYIDFKNFDNQISCDRKSHAPTFFADGGVTVVKISSLFHLEENLLPFQWMGKKIGHIEQLSGGGDIDFEWQIKVIEWWLSKSNFTSTTTPYQGL